MSIGAAVKNSVTLGGDASRADQCQQDRLEIVPPHPSCTSRLAVGSEKKLGMATTIAFSSVGVLSSTPAFLR